MKEVVAELGGRPFANDDLLTLQTELSAAATAAFLGKGAFIVSGCLVSGPATGATITAGIVCLDGQLLRFAGQSSVALPAQLQAGAVVLSDPRLYQTGGTKNCMREVPAVLVASNPAYTLGEFLPLDTWGGKRWEHVQRAAVRSPNEVQWLAAFNPDDYDSDGLGKPGSEAWGWGLCDGRGGRRNLGGQVAVARDANRSDYDTVGKAGGKEQITLTTSQLPSHTHASNNLIVDSRGDGEAEFRAAYTASTGAKGKGLNIQPTGGDQPHENRMPYTVLLARQWVGF